MPHPARAPLKSLLHRAGAAALAHYDDPDPVLKADRSHVTEADKVSEDILVEGLLDAFPGSGVRGEEGARVAGKGTWHIDPIDGTSAFVEGLGLWGPTVCLVEDGELMVGAFYQPCLRLFWFAAPGAGAWCNERRLQPQGVPETPRYNDSLYLPSRSHQVGPLPWPGKTRGVGASAAHMAMAASGGAAATVIIQWKLWDIGAGALLVQEAGREICRLDGGSIDLVAEEGLPFMAGAPNALRYLTARLATRDDLRPR